MTDQFLLRRHQEQFGAVARSLPPSLASSQRLK